MHTTAQLLETKKGIEELLAPALERLVHHESFTARVSAVKVLPAVYAKSSDDVRINYRKWYVNNELLQRCSYVMCMQIDRNKSCPMYIQIQATV